MVTTRTRRRFLTLMAAVIGIVAGFTSITHSKSKHPSGQTLAEQKHLAAKSRASYEQIRSAIGEIRVGDARSAVLELMRDKMNLGVDDRAGLGVRERTRTGLDVPVCSPGVLTSIVEAISLYRKNRTESPQPISGISRA